MRSTSLEVEEDMTGGRMSTCEMFGKQRQAKAMNKQPEMSAP